MKTTISIIALLIVTISINSCSSDTNYKSTGIFTANLIDGSTQKPIANIDGASWGVEFSHDIDLQTSNYGNNVLLINGKLKINMAESTGKIRSIGLFAIPNLEFDKKYYSQGYFGFSPASSLEQSQVYYTKAKIKCIVNITKSENIGKEFYLELIEPIDQKKSIKQSDKSYYSIKPLVLGSQTIYIDAIGNYKNQVKWILNEELPFVNIEVNCNEGETKELTINL